MLLLLGREILGFIIEMVSDSNIAFLASLPLLRRIHLHSADYKCNMPCEFYPLSSKISKFLRSFHPIRICEI